VIGAKSLLVVEHALVADRLAALRDARTPPERFRSTVEELGFFLAYEATRTLPAENHDVRTPVGAAQVRRITGRPIIAPILRAGLGLLPGFLRAFNEDATVAHLGFFRDPKTLEAIPYYANISEDISQRECYVLDPMLATGHTACAALQALVSHGARTIIFVCLVAAPEGVAELERRYPDVRIITAALDEGLNDHGYIVPGLGDAGDRMFGS
jgi:uracil phosphoribosyltransferase